MALRHAKNAWNQEAAPGSVDTTHACGGSLRLVGCLAR